MLVSVFSVRFLDGCGHLGSAIAMDSDVKQCKTMASCSGCMPWVIKISIGLCVSGRNKCFK